MSLKFRRIRESKKFTKTNLAKAAEVSFRTVTNWEKANGTTPPLDTMKVLAAILGVSLYDISTSFLEKPDEIETDTGFKFHDHTSDFLNCYSKASEPYQLFKLIDGYRLYGESKFIYEHKVFEFIDVILHDIPEGEEFTPEIREAMGTSTLVDRLIIQMLMPYDAAVLIDDNCNAIVLDKEGINSWKLKEFTREKAIIELALNKAIIPEMDSRIADNQEVVAYLHLNKKDIFPKPTDKKKTFVVRKDDNVIQSYLRVLRTRSGQTLAELEQSLKKQRIDVSLQALSRWESGSLIPSPKHLMELSEYYRVNYEDVLESYSIGYFISSILEGEKSCCNVGITHSFFNVDSYNKFVSFIREYNIFCSAVYQTNTTGGHLVIDMEKLNIQNISFDKEAVRIDLKDSGYLSFTYQDMKSVIPVSIHFGTHFHFDIVCADEEKEYFFSIYLIYILPDNIADIIEEKRQLKT